MKKTLRLKYLKQMIMVGMVAILSISPIGFTFAQQIPEISPWAMGVLNEGEKYGIYPLEWYYEGFLQPISSEKLEKLVQGVRWKLDALNLPVDQSFVPLKVEGTTREAVLATLYNEVAKYEAVVGLSITKDDPITYFQERGILNGTGNGLELNQLATVEQSVVFASRLIEDTYALVGAGSKGFMWEVKNEGNTLYLLGSIHVGKSNMYPLDVSVKEAFKNSDLLIVEANIFSQGQGMEEFIALAMCEEGKTFKDYVSEEAFNQTMEVLSLYNLPEEQFMQFKPWSIANDLNTISMSQNQTLESAGEASLLGVDMYFLTTAAVEGKPIAELEGLKYQGELFDGLSLEEQEMYLLSVTNEILNPQIEEVMQTSLDYITLWQEYWYEGNDGIFKESYEEVTQNEESEFSKMLFGKRDENMVEKLTSLLEREGQGTYFVVIGAGHLTIDGMVTDQLRAKGYEVVPFHR